MAVFRFGLSSVVVPEQLDIYGLRIRFRGICSEEKHNNIEADVN